MSRPRLPRLLPALVLVALLAVAGACGSSGREMSEPATDATTPARRPNAAGTLGPSTTLGTVFAITTDAWSPGGTIPDRYTCEGEDISPPLVLSKIPDGTVELAVVVDDPDADGYVHWVVAGIDPTITAIEEGTVPAGAVQAANASGSVGWSGPCPPEGELHTYDFTLYALVVPSGVTDGQDGDEAVAAIASAQSATPPALMTGVFER